MNLSWQLILQILHSSIARLSIVRLQQMPNLTFKERSSSEAQLDQKAPPPPWVI
jgi:hypothetical protein